MNCVELMNYVKKNQEIRVKNQERAKIVDQIGLQLFFLDSYLSTLT